MAVSPRKNEVDAVVAILESAEPVLDENGQPVLDPETGEAILGSPYDDARSMAAAIVRALGAEFARRETYVVIPPGSPIAYGPHWTETEAARAWTKEIGPVFGGRQGRLLRTFPWEPHADEQVACECGHGRHQHVVPGPKNKPGKPSECGVFTAKSKGSRCPCVTYTQRKVA